MSRQEKFVTTVAVLALLVGVAACGDDSPQVDSSAPPTLAPEIATIPSAVGQSTDQLIAYLQSLTQQSDEASEALLLGQTTLPGADDTESHTL